MERYFSRSKVRSTARWGKHIVTFNDWLPYVQKKVERRTGMQIEVTRIPDILLTQLEELTASFERLEADLASDFTGSETTEPGGRDG